MWKLLVISFLMSVKLMANENLNSEILKVAKNLKSKVTFEEKMGVFIEFEKALINLDKSYDKKRAKKDLKSYIVLSEAITTMELIDFTRLQLRECPEALNKIRVSFDPQMSDIKKMRLPDIVQRIYDLLANTCAKNRNN